VPLRCVSFGTIAASESVDRTWAGPTGGEDRTHRPDSRCLRRGPLGRVGV